ncbi:hypothetical protein [Brevibacillus borstelensis]|uniref:hypothetical protein n=1 Tax=Brevibacillus borstelensis TaxID=45462 RepID=UPI0030F4F92D
MIHKDYLTLARNDLLSRVNGGSLLINDSVSMPVKSAAISSHPIVGLQNAIALQVQAQHVDSVPVIRNLKLLTSDGVIVSEKVTQISASGAQFFSLTFVVQVKGGGQ